MDEGTDPLSIDENGGHTISTKIDLGFSGYFKISGQLLESLEERCFLGKQIMCGIQNNKYEEEVFEFPEVRIGNISLYRIPIQKEPEEFHQQSSIVQDGTASSPAEPGRIGWKAFETTNVLLNLSREELVFCDTFATLQEHGYALESFVKTDLFTDHNLIEIKVETIEGALRCILDTGCTFNLLHTESLVGKSIRECIWGPEASYECMQLQIEGREFGPVSFCRVPIQLPCAVDAILGMDFFQNHILYIDFPNNAVYIAWAKPAISQS